MTLPEQAGSNNKGFVDLDSLRKQLSLEGEKPKFWRSFEEAAGAEEFSESLKNEFIHQALPIGRLNRRGFLKLLAAPLAMAGLSACVPQSSEKIVPYVNAPDGLVPGEPLYYTTAIEEGGYARGLLIKSTMGRPLKAEGNPNHPASLGATDIFAQASLLSLYDPDRTQVISNQGQIRTWGSFLTIVAEALSSQQAVQGKGLRILTGTITSPTLGSQLNSLLQAFPQAKWIQYDPINLDNVRAGARLAFGEVVQTQYHFDRADVILSIDDDFTSREPGSLRYLKDFSGRRKVLKDQTKMNRLYVVESTVSNAGATADHRLALQASQIEDFTREIASRLGLNVGASAQLPQLPQGWLDALINDLRNNSGTCLVLAGPQQPPVVHALVHTINQILGNVGATVTYTDSVEIQPADQMASLKELVADLNSGLVDVLVVFGGNPVYSTPADLDFAASYSKARMKVYLGQYDDETASLSDWHIPSAHYLEIWSDTRAFDGTASIVQPLIEPLYGGKSPHEILGVLSGQVEINGYDLVKQFWQNQFQDGNLGSGDFETFWEQALHDGVIPNSSFARKQVNLSIDFSALTPTKTTPEGANSLEIVFEPDPTIWDGEYSNNAWLQELPKPLSKVTWDNPALVSPETALQLGLANGDRISLQFNDQSVEAPVWIQPGQPTDTVTVHLGYGRTQGGQVAPNHGYNAYKLRTSDAPWFSYGLALKKTGSKYKIAATHDHNSMEGRDLIRTADIQEFQANPNLFNQFGQESGNPPSLYPEYPYDGYAWGMSINLNSCVGCNACVIACQAENNIPVVGKDEVTRGHEMHWLRVDRYYSGDLDQPDIHYEPVPCMQCERAPCEPVCPVEATVHDKEGLNEMVYNRCVGTRYCSNNCPYKVRRFNFYQYSDELTVPLKLLNNPEVTVRFRGVMEKCTYCIQRISAARIQAEEEGRSIRDGELRTACQQACPTDAIIFGNINDESSQVRNLKEEPHNYTLLAELGTLPRTSYLAKIKNPNPEIKGQNS